MQAKGEHLAAFLDGLLTWIISPASRLYCTCRIQLCSTPEAMKKLSPTEAPCQLDRAPHCSQIFRHDSNTTHLSYRSASQLAGYGQYGQHGRLCTGRDFAEHSTSTAPQGPWLLIPALRNRFQGVPQTSISHRWQTGERSCWQRAHSMYTLRPLEILQLSLHRSATELCSCQVRYAGAGQPALLTACAFNTLY